MIKTLQKKELNQLKTRKLLKWLNHLVTGLLLVLLVGVAFMVLITKFSNGEPEVFGYQLKTVLSGSMEPGIMTGSIIAVQPTAETTKFKENDIITYMEADNKIVTHRIVEVIQNGENVMYTTKGDNNNAPDRNPVLSDNVMAKYTGITVPYLGYFINFSQSKNGAFLLLIPGLILLLYSIYSIWRAVSEIDKTQQERIGTSKK